MVIKRFGYKYSYAFNNICGSRIVTYSNKCKLIYSISNNKISFFCRKGLVK